jgi:hypothetical protein
MKPLNGTRLLHFPFQGLHYEGPLLSLFHNTAKENHIFCWCDTDGMVNRWLLLRVAQESLDGYLQGDLSLYQLLTNPSDDFVYVVDIDDDDHYQQVYRISITDLPGDYLPEKESYYQLDAVYGEPERKNSSN